MAKKQQLGYKEIEERLKALKETQVPANEVGYQILYSFGKGERDIARYKEGKGILKTFDGLLIKGLFCFKSASSLGLSGELERLKHDTQVLKATPKIIAVSDGKTILAYDLREKDTYENKVDRLYCDFAFFYPLMDVERVHYVEESPADIKAAEKLAKLHDELRAYNEFNSEADLHDLNIFITRLLFCFFAEDTGIFEENLFSDSIRRFTKPDGSDLSEYLDAAFNIMDCNLRTTETLSIIKQFPYVNGGLFAKHIQIPRMGAKARQIIIECGELDWKDINPDIFGSMIQAVVNPEERANQGMHYTSVPNIMKVINPLFLDELREEYRKLEEQLKQLQQEKDLGSITSQAYYKACVPVERRCRQLLLRISKMKFFDPACGSGNFLIITYKSLRLLEMDILKIIRQCNQNQKLDFIDGSCISLGQFYGIELLDFPHEVAMLSLWLAEHQMNRKFHDSFGVNTRALPLHNITQIVCGNACRLDWNTVCPHTTEEEVFVFGNPPYLGSRNQNETQKEDMDICFSPFKEFKGYRKLDYIACWFLKGANFIKKTSSKYSFVSTSSITQGEQVIIFWEPLFSLFNIEIFYAYKAFKWENNAKNNAALTVIILGLSNISMLRKYIYDEINKKEIKYISPNLNEEKNLIVQKITSPISKLPEMRRGNMPNDKEFLRLSNWEKETLIQSYPKAKQYIRKQIGADEFINSIDRYCYWIKDEDLPKAILIPPIKKAIESVKQYRLNSKDKTLHAQAEKPHQMREFFECLESSILVPIVSSENREYIPIGIVGKGVIVPNSAQVIYNGNSFVLGLLLTKMHTIWAKHNAGRLENRIRYSIFMCYNTFPVPPINEEKKKQIEEAAENVLMTRAYYPEKTLAELYDPDKMPEDLREAHATLDDIVESCYPGYPFRNDEMRLECLFKLYEKMTKKQNPIA